MRSVRVERLASMGFGEQVAAVLDVMPPNARLLEDEIQWDRSGMFSRISSLPVDFGA